MTIKSSYMKIKHNYNPFKMWFPVTVGIITYILFFIMVGTTENNYGGMWNSAGLSFESSSLAWFLPLAYAIPAFLIGWGIHSFFRRWRRK